MNTFSKVSEHKKKKHTKVSSLLNNKPAEKEMKKNVPYTIAPDFKIP
jgi:hypothetical protein